MKKLFTFLIAASFLPSGLWGEEIECSNANGYYGCIVCGSAEMVLGTCEVDPPISPGGWILNNGGGTSQYNMDMRCSPGGDLFRISCVNIYPDVACGCDEIGRVRYYSGSNSLENCLGGCPSECAIAMGYVIGDGTLNGCPIKTEYGLYSNQNVKVTPGNGTTSSNCRNDFYGEGLEKIIDKYENVCTHSLRSGTDAKGEYYYKCSNL